MNTSEPSAPASPEQALPSPPGGHDAWIVIDGSDSAAPVSFRELWRSRDLLRMFAQRDLAVRYRQAVIGVGWALIRPALSVAVISLLFGHWGRKDGSSWERYVAVALTGVLAWQLFAALVADLSESLVRNRSVLTKVYFPRVLIPLGASAVAIADYLVGLLPSVVVLGCLGIVPDWRILFFPVWLAGVLLFSLSVGLFLSGLNARYRDVGHVVPFALQIGLFVSPVLYETSTLIPERWRTLYWCNPLAVLLDGMRWSLLDAPLPSAGSLALGAAMIAGGAVLSWRLFHRLDHDVAERI